MRKADGFSLIELLIVVAIILIIAAIAIPNLLRARIAANEASAVSSMRTIVSAEATYQLAYPAVGFAATMAQLGPGGAGSSCSGPTQAATCLVDSLLSNATSAASAKSGHFFGLAGVTGGSLGGQLHCGCIRLRVQLHRRARLLFHRRRCATLSESQRTVRPRDCARNLHRLYGPALKPPGQNCRRS